MTMAWEGGSVGGAGLIDIEVDEDVGGGGGGGFTGAVPGGGMGGLAGIDRDDWGLEGPMRSFSSSGLK